MVFMFCFVFVVASWKNELFCVRDAFFFLRSENARSSCMFDLVLSVLGEELCPHDDRLLWEPSLSEHLEVTSAGDVDNGDRHSLLPILPDVLGDQVPQSLHVDHWAELLLVPEVKVPHSTFPEVSRVAVCVGGEKESEGENITTKRERWVGGNGLSVEEGTEVVKSTSVSTATLMLPVLDWEKDEKRKQ